MLDIQFIRDNPDKVKNAAKDKGLDENMVEKTIEEVLRLDSNLRPLDQEIQKLRAERNKISSKFKGKKISAVDGKFPEKFQDDYKKAFAIKQKLKDLEPQLKKLEASLNDLIFRLPNIPKEDVHIGKDETDNKVLRKWGKIPKFDFKPKHHLDLGTSLDIIDVKRASKVSGSRFAYLKNEAVLLEFALVQFALNTLNQKGFIPIIPPALTKVAVFHKLGYSEHGGNEDYYLVYDPKKEDPEEEANYYLIGTAEHAIVPYYQNEILNHTKLPKRFVAFSSAFRREAGSYGKDTKGILRVHQFDKVEMVSITTPEKSDEEHEYLLSLEEELFQALNIPYQVVKMCTGDLGHPTARKYDLEAWIPSENKYREVTSTSTTTDYQSRRLKIKYQDIGKRKFVHMLNGTAYAIGRTIIAILENNQQKDGSITIPPILRPYVGFDSIKSKNGK